MEYQGTECHRCGRGCFEDVSQAFVSLVTKPVSLVSHKGRSIYVLKLDGLHLHKLDLQGCDRQISWDVLSATFSFMLLAVGFTEIYCIFRPIRRKGSQKVHRMIADPVLRHYTLQVHHICVVSECKNTSIRHFGWQQRLRPGSSGVLCRPCLLAVASETVDEYNTNSRPYQHVPSFDVKLTDSTMLLFAL